MANYNRTIISSIWSNKMFRKLTAKEKVFYFLLHTGEITSDTSVFPCLLDDCALYCGVSINEIKKMMHHFEELGLVYYDYDSEEICVLDYFGQHEPTGGLTYEMYRKDLSKISSEKVLEILVENSKKYDISLPFFAALQDLIPGLCEDDFKIKPTDKTVDEIRTAAKRGRSRAKSSSKELKEDDTEISRKKWEEKVDKYRTQKTDPDIATGIVTDEELPF